MLIMSQPYIFGYCHNVLPMLMTKINVGKANKICQISVKNFDYEKFGDQVLSKHKYHKKISDSPYQHVNRKIEKLTDCHHVMDQKS